MLHIREFNYLEDVMDILYLDLREEDIKEIYDLAEESPNEALATIINKHEVLYIIEDDYERPLGIFGTVIDKDYKNRKVGSIFFLATTELLEEHSMEFLRRSEDVVLDLLEDYQYDTLYNYVSSENLASLKWLEWLGFEVFKNQRTYFKNPKVPFYFFKIERE